MMALFSIAKSWSSSSFKSIYVTVPVPGPLAPPPGVTPDTLVTITAVFDTTCVADAVHTFSHCARRSVSACPVISGFKVFSAFTTEVAHVDPEPLSAILSPML
jgi:hypothetical protein